MPISNGYETCKIILEVYQQRVYSLQRDNQFNLHIYKPIMVAFQNEEITERAIAYSYEAGFNTVVSAPIDFQVYKSQIKPILDDRSKFI